MTMFNPKNTVIHVLSSPQYKGGGDISTFLKFWEGGNHLLGPPPYSVFENFGGGVPTFRTPPYSVFEKKIYPFNF